MPSAARHLGPLAAVILPAAAVSRTPTFGFKTRSGTMPEGYRIEGTRHTVIYRTANDATLTLRVSESQATYDSHFRSVAKPRYAQELRSAMATVKTALECTDCIRSNVSPMLLANPELVRVYRHACCPPLAPDRLMALAKIPKGLISKMEEGARPASLAANVDSIARELIEFANPELQALYDDSTTRPQAFAWVASTVANATFSSWLRNEQEHRQQRLIREYLEPLGYTDVTATAARAYYNVGAIPLHPGTFAFGRHVNVAPSAGKAKKLPIDCIVAPMGGGTPVLLELKSAGDETNTNKRQKEEADKLTKLRSAYSSGTPYIYCVVLCGYFGLNYCHYVAQSGIDFVWDHDLQGLADFGIG